MTDDVANGRLASNVHPPMQYPRRPETMLTDSEIMLALRSPDAGWLAVVTCVLDEANHDPCFSPHQRDVLLQLIEHNMFSPTVANGARRRAARFEQELNDEASAFNDVHGDATGCADEPVAARPKLTLVGSNAC